MASVEDCEKALHVLAERMANNNAGRKINLDRTLACSVSDLKVVFGGRLHDGKLLDIGLVDKSAAQVTLTLTSDDLVDMVDGKIKLGSAWAAGKIKVDASVLDLVRLRSVF